MRATITGPLLTFAALAYAHGRIVDITTSSGAVYKGWDPEWAQNTSALQPLAAWSASNLGNIYVTPNSFNTSNIACHFNSKPGAIHVNVTAGESLRLRWNEWPVSHKGPVLNYLAACNGSCADADKERLEWVKIEELGWLNSTNWELGLGGTWATDVLIADAFTWTAQIPEELAEGTYVLRHEIIALHVAELPDGAQSYPQCVNLRVTRDAKASGNGVQINGGVIGSHLYRSDDAGILVDIHERIDGYDIPGPKLWEVTGT